MKKNYCYQIHVLCYVLLFSLYTHIAQSQDCEDISVTINTPTCISTGELVYTIIEINGIENLNPSNFQLFLNTELVKNTYYDKTIQHENGFWVFYAIPITEKLSQYTFRLSTDSCTQEFSKSINAFDFSEYTVKKVSCPGYDDGIIQLNYPSDYEIQWEDGQTGHTRTNLTAGIYRAQIKKKNSCSYTKAFLVEEPRPLQIEIFEKSIGCGDVVDNMLYVEISGGTGPYLYDWDEDGMGDMDDSPEIHPEDIDPSKVYTIQVLDSNGCLAETQYSPKFDQIDAINANHATIRPLKNMGDDQFLFVLSDAENAANGDIDNDGKDGSIMVVTYHTSESDAYAGINPLQDTIVSYSTDIFARVSSQLSCFAVAALTLDEIELDEELFQLVTDQVCAHETIMRIEFEEPIDNPMEDYELRIFSRQDPNQLNPLPFYEDADGLYIDPREINQGTYDIYLYRTGSDVYIASDFFVIQAVNGALTTLGSQICQNSERVLLETINMTLSGIDLPQAGVEEDGDSLYFNPMGLEPGEYYINYSITGEFGNPVSFSCERHYVDTVLVVPVPTLTEALSSSYQFCEGEEITIIAQTEAPDNIFRWIRDGSILSTDDTLHYASAIEELEGDYRLLIQDANRCRVEEDFTIEVNQNPIVNIPDVAICRDEIQNLTIDAFDDYVIDNITSNGTATDPSTVSLMPPTSLSISTIGLDAGQDTVSFTFSNAENCTTTADLNLDITDCFDLGLIIKKQDENINENIGDVVVFEVEVHNQGIQDANMVEVIVELPPDLEFVETEGWTLLDNGFIQYIVPDLASGDVETLTFPAINNYESPTETLTFFAEINSAKNDFTTDPADDDDAPNQMDSTEVDDEIGDDLDDDPVDEDRRDFVSLRSCIFSADEVSLQVCSELPQNNEIEVTLSDLESDVLAAITPADVYDIVGFYSTLEDATNQTSTPLSEMITTGSTTIYAGVINNNGCKEAVAINITVNESPFVNLPTLEICRDIEFEMEIGNFEMFEIGDFTLNESNIAVSDITLTQPNLLSINTIGAEPGSNELDIMFSDSNDCTYSTQLVFDIIDCFDVGLIITKKGQDVEAMVDSFNVEVQNHGVLDAYDVEVIVELPMDLVFDPDDPANEGWELLDNGYLRYVIPKLDAGQNRVLCFIALNEFDDPNDELKFFAEIISADNEFTEDPVDEDTVDGRTDDSNEINDEINDENSNGIDDNPEDEDRRDYVIVSACAFSTTNLTLEYCTGIADATTINLDLSTIAADVLASIMPDGAYNLVDFYNTEEEARDQTGESLPSIISTGTRTIYAGVVNDNGDCKESVRIDIHVFDISGTFRNPEDLELEEGDDAVFDISLSDPDINVQWQEFINGEFVDIANETSTTLVIEDVTLDDDNRTFRARLAKDFGISVTCEYTTEPALLTLDNECKALACNNGIQVSVGQNCSIDITADQVLEGNYRPRNYSITLTDQYDREINHEDLAMYINKTLNYTILDSCSFNSCWGTILIEDKLVPLLDCSTDTIACYVDIDPVKYGVPIAAVDSIESIGNNQYLVTSATECLPITMTLIESQEELDCNSGILVAIKRTWVAVDQSDNRSDCTQTIYVRSEQPSEILWPEDFDGDELPAFQCELLDSIPMTDDGYPHPDTTGYPEILVDGQKESLGFCGDYGVEFEDSVLESCAGGYIINRKWEIIQWCTGHSSEHNQVIKVEGAKPILHCNSDTIRIRSNDSCTTDYTFMPDVEAPCGGNLQYTARVLKASYSTNGCEDRTEFEGGITRNVTINDDGTLTIPGLNSGCNYIELKVQNDCGKSDQCVFRVTVEDRTIPTVVCADRTVIGIGVDGIGYLLAESIDEGSHDNCGIDSFRIAKMEDVCSPDTVLVFDTKAQFCCEEVGKTIMVQLKVWDTSGNHSSCMVEAQVQNKSLPRITCPEDIVIECTENVENLELTGRPLSGYSCDSIRFSYSDSKQTNQCGIGTIIRTWYTESGESKTEICSQKIEVVNSNPIEYPMEYFPKDTILYGCSADTDVERMGSPRLDIEMGCALLASNHEDRRFSTNTDNCQNIRRVWTVIDWCSYDPATQQGVWYANQLISINDTIAPVLADCQDQIIVCSTSDDCQGLLELDLIATDDCSSLEDLNFNYSIALEGIDSMVVGHSRAISQHMPFGKHTLHWQVSDECNNRSQCMSEIILQDCKAPTPYCLAQISTVTMSTTNSVAIWASDFDLGSTDNCTAQEDLQFSFSQDTAYTSKVFDCLDVAPGASEGFSLSLWVTDQHGNQDYCTVQLLVENHNTDSTCDVQMQEDMTLTGRIQGLNKDALSDVIISIKNKDSERKEYSDANGNYDAFLSTGENYEISLSKPDDFISGLSTGDLVLMQRHILGIQRLQDGIITRSADADHNGKISVGDVVRFKKILLGITDELDQYTTPWLFEAVVDNSDYMSKIENGLELYKPPHDLAINFISNKLGDVNQSYRSKLKSLNTKTLPIIVVGERNQTDVMIDGDQLIYGMQFELIGIESFDGLSSDIFEISSDDYSYDPMNKTLRISWVGEHPIETSVGDALVTITHNTPIFTQSAPRISTSFDAEWYDQQANTYKIIESAVPSKTKANAVLQNQPNPFANFTEIHYQLSDATSVQLQVFDMNGRLVYSKNERQSAGDHLFEITSEDLENKPGVYQYRVQIGSKYFQNKMVLF